MTSLYSTACRRQLRDECTAWQLDEFSNATPGAAAVHEGTFSEYHWLLVDHYPDVSYSQARCRGGPTMGYSNLNQSRTSTHLLRFRTLSCQNSPRSCGGPPDS